MLHFTVNNTICYQEAGHKRDGRIVRQRKEQLYWYGLTTLVEAVHILPKSEINEGTPHVTQYIVSAGIDLVFVAKMLSPVHIAELNRT